ncbi:MAG: PLP-dependent aminotransferase family protein [Candidatus Obscuribacterales bacterium]|jgi:GntR family transcriptional regulator/MocR family aminotransferase
MDLGFLLDLKGKTTYRSLADAIAKSVDSGTLVKGEKLPSARELALFTQCSRTTVVHAFDELTARGYLHSVKGDATYISRTFTETLPLNNLSETIQETKAFDWTSKYNDLSQQLLLQKADFVSSGDFKQLNYGALPNELLPLRQWRRILTEHCNSENPFVLADRQDVFGYRPLRQAIADLLRRSKGMRCRAEQIVIYPSSQSALAHLMQLLVKPGDTAICEEPGYSVAREQFRSHETEVRSIPVDEKGLNVKTLRDTVEKADWLYLTPSGQDPTGAILSESRRLELLNWAQARGAAIIEDGWDSDFHYGGPVPPPLHTMDTQGCVIYAHTFWRLLFPLVSTAFLVIPEKLIPLFTNSKHVADHQYPLIEHYVLTKFIQDGDFENHIRSSWKILRERRQAMIFELKQAFGERIRITSPGAGMHLVVRFDQQWSQAVVAHAAESVGLPLASSTSYYSGPAHTNEFLVPFTSLPVEKTADLIKTFAQALFAC